MYRLSVQTALIASLTSALSLKARVGQCNDEWDPATWLQSTDQTFNLEQACTSLDDDDCVCFTEGFVDWGLGRSPENYFNSDEY